MEKAYYLVALALIRQNDRRFMPLGGKSIEANYSIEKSSTGKESASKVTTELLIRIFQRTEEGCIERGNEELSLLLMKIEYSLLQEKLPIIKSNWINDGNGTKLISALKDLSEEIWKVEHAKYEGIKYVLV